VKYFVAIAGNIGVGKSTLTDLLCYRMGWQPFYEAVSDNPYLSDFYKDMDRWGFHSQMFFLSRRLQHHIHLLEHPSSVIQDRTMYEDAEVFVENLYRQGRLSQRDYRTYREMYETLVEMLRPPDLVIYLRASAPTLQKRIRLRGREYERALPAEYLEQLNFLYDEWIGWFRLCPVLVIPADDLDFVRYSEHMDMIAAQVMERLSGQEELIPA
jgi:deoxyadenosine/deoxycytidine kinase